ncbi:MAG: glycine betaine ABC transporter substrate-binding protein [Chthoniobacterales bacterium]
MKDIAKPQNLERRRGLSGPIIAARRRLPHCSLCCLVLFLIQSASAGPVIIGSKKFTESYVLGEIAKRAMTNAGVPVEVRQGMGGTIILWEALRTGAISCYPDYTGTVSEEILKQPEVRSEDAIRSALAQFGVGMTGDLGFDNTYALVMLRTAAARLGIHTISDLRQHPELRFGLTHEFLDRRDGWNPLAQRYRLSSAKIRGIDHALGYQALANGDIDVKDAYSTDAKIAQNDLVVLGDDLRFFPQYKAAFLYRLEMPAAAVDALRRLQGTINEERMTRLNAEAEQTRDYTRAAELYFNNASARSTAETLAHKLARWTARHLELAGVSLLLAILVGVPLGIVASRGGAAGHAILAFASTVQTIPSLALLALLIPLPFFGISPRTAIAALFLYGLLPIVRNTATGLQDIAPSIRESAIALGLDARARLFQINLPIASRTILAGIKTSAVINIGTATLAALIGAGGLGEPILSGLNLNDNRTILQGAIPAALLALVVQWLFDLLDRVLIPRGLRL